MDAQTPTLGRMSGEAFSALLGRMEAPRVDNGRFCPCGAAYVAEEDRTQPCGGCRIDTLARTTWRAYLAEVDTYLYARRRGERAEALRAEQRMAEEYARIRG